MHPTGQGHDVSTPPSLNASWTVAQAPLERNSLVSSAAWTNTLIPPKLLLILVVVSFVYTVPGRRFLHFHHGTCLYCRNSIYCSQIQHIFRSMEYVERKKTTVVSRFRQKISAVIFRYAYKKRERKKEKEKCFLFFSFCFGHKKIVFFSRKHTCRIIAFAESFARRCCCCSSSARECSDAKAEHTRGLRTKTRLKIRVL